MAFSLLGNAATNRSALFAFISVALFFLLSSLRDDVPHGPCQPN